MVFSNIYHMLVYVCIHRLIVINIEKERQTNRNIQTLATHKVLYIIYSCCIWNVNSYVHMIYV